MKSANGRRSQRLSPRADKSPLDRLLPAADAVRDQKSIAAGAIRYAREARSPNIKEPSSIANRRTELFELVRVHNAKRGLREATEGLGARNRNHKLTNDEMVAFLDLISDDDGERGRGQPAPHETQQGADTPGHRASEAAGNVADPHLAPVGRRGAELSSSTSLTGDTITNDQIRELRRDVVGDTSVSSVGTDEVCRLCSQALDDGRLPFRLIAAARALCAEIWNARRTVILREGSPGSGRFA
jgi:hypothetical protein